MDKEKLLNLIDDYSDISFNAGYGTDSQSLHKLDDKWQEIKAEINSKPIMPKLFLKWDNEINSNIINRQLYELGRVMGGETRTPTERELFKYLINDPNNFARYINCVHAICNGDYEVIK